MAWVHRQARRFHARRGVRLAGRLRVARTSVAWRRILGVADARTYSGFTTLEGAIFLGPAATDVLEVVGRSGRARAWRGAVPSRADADRMTMALALLLHETLHATGPLAVEDVTGSRSGLAFEEGFAEAATVNLLRPFVAGLDLPATLRQRLLAAVGRYRPAYRAQVAWARRLSATATGSPPGSPRARAWRIRVADTWGAGRWARLAAATRIDEQALRASAAAAAAGGD